MICALFCELNDDDEDFHISIIINIICVPCCSVEDREKKDVSPKHHVKRPKYRDFEVSVAR